MVGGNHSPSTSFTMFIFRSSWAATGKSSPYCISFHRFASRRDSDRSGCIFCLLFRGSHRSRVFSIRVSGGTITKTRMPSVAVLSRFVCNGSNVPTPIGVGFTTRTITSQRHGGNRYATATPSHYHRGVRLFFLILVRASRRYE